jgi:hypothetical protein
VVELLRRLTAENWAEMGRFAGEAALAGLRLRSLGGAKGDRPVVGRAATLLTLANRNRDPARESITMDRYRSHKHQRTRHAAIGWLSFRRLRNVRPVVVARRRPTGQRPPRNPARKFRNRLAKETSPYLLLHAHNPVDWYPWGEEALAKAKREGKPILLSIGYSSCHWCHVMERESFLG